MRHVIGTAAFRCLGVCLGIAESVEKHAIVLVLFAPPPHPSPSCSLSGSEFTSRYTLDHRVGIFL